jgi:hypothetical protein
MCQRIGIFTVGCTELLRLGLPVPTRTNPILVLVLTGQNVIFFKTVFLPKNAKKCCFEKYYVLTGQH